MQNFYIDTLQVHSSTQRIGFSIAPNAQGDEMPSIRLSSYDKPGEFGSFVSNQLYGSRLITIEVLVYADDLVTFDVRRRALQSAVQIIKDENSVPIPKLLKFTTDAGLAMQVYGYCTKVKPLIKRNMFCRYAIEFTCPGFVLESQTLKTATLTAPVGGGAVYPVVYPVIYAPSSGGVVTITNNGDAKAYVLITATGILTNPVINNVTVGRRMALDTTIGASDSVVIAMADKTILKNTNISIISKKTIGSRWFWLDPGVNIFRLTTDDSDDDGQVQVAYRDSYIGS